MKYNNLTLPDFYYDETFTVEFEQSDSGSNHILWLKINDELCILFGHDVIKCFGGTLHA